ncbi:MAG: hypothetical protein N2652_11915 [Kiritimatiellae bacterium]|nr:hypothetical protein [Kiritimatiellia bacterium]
MRPRSPAGPLALRMVGLPVLGAGGVFGGWLAAQMREAAEMRSWPHATAWIRGWRCESTAAKSSPSGR